jgi:response regulator RpfG family c-di-GMP phosphodiesterase
VVAPAQSVRILVVDDEEQIAQLLAGILRNEGHRAEYVTDGEAALQRMRQGSFDLLVTDLRMPRMDGMRLIAEARELDPDLDALVMTAYSSTESAVDALRKGVADYLPKPFGVKEIRSSLDKVLRGRAERRQRARQVEDLSARVDETQLSLEQKVADLTLLHDLTRLIAGRNAPLLDSLGRIAEHFAADHVILTEQDRVVERFGTVNVPGLREMARLATRSGLPRLDGGCMAAPLNGGAVALHRGDFYDREDLRVLAIAARDLALAVENDRLRADQRRAYVGIVATLIEAVEAKDLFNRGHSRRVADLAVRFAHHLGLPEREIEVLETGAKLHDIGKIGIPEQILNKPGRLTDEEYEVVKTHPVIGEQIIMPLQFLAETRPIVRHHHERWDGAGYPDGLLGDKIPKLAALLSIVDAFDALTSDRPYREGMPPDQATRILRDGAGRQWNPDLVRQFVAI